MGGSRRPAIWRVLTEKPGSAVIDPEDYLAASGEAVLATIVVGWVLTAIFVPETFKSNALKNRLGYNNPCVGLDMPPVNAVGLFGLGFASFLTWRYAELDATRTRLTRPAGWLTSERRRLFVFADYLYAMSTQARVQLAAQLLLVQRHCRGGARR